MSSILKGLTNEGENVTVIYIDGKPIAKYTEKHKAEDEAQRIRKKFPNKKIEVKQEVREAEGDTLHDPEYALPEARRITKAIKYDDTVGDIVTQIQMLAERTEGIDSKTLEYSIDRVLSAKNSLESEVYGLEEAFEDAARNAQYKRDDVDEGNYNNNRTGFRRGPRDDERHDLDVQKPSNQVWGLKINGKVWSKDGKDVTFASKEQALKARQTLLAKRPELEIGLVTRNVSETLDENLKQWFKEKWVRFGPDGKIRGDCARGDDSEGKPKCLPQSKAQNLGKEGRASAAARKRREDPNPERNGKAINVNTKKKTNEADEWEESSEKWHRFQRWSIDQMMRSPERTATGNHVSELENKTFGHPITYETGAGIVSQQPFGAVQTNIGAGRKWTAWVKSIMDNYLEYEAQWKADSAADLVDNQQYKEFLDRAYKDFISMGENSYEQREQHAIALSGYQVKYFGGKLFGSLGGNIKGARASMTPEIFGVLEKAEAYLVQKNIIDYDNRRNAELLKFWEMLPYPIKLMVAAGMGKTPAQVEAILKTTGKSDTEIMGAYLNASEPQKPTKPEEPTKPKNMSEDQLDEKCWDSHKQVGMKSKGSKMVPNCVPKESVTEEKKKHHFIYEGIWDNIKNIFKAKPKYVRPTQKIGELDSEFQQRVTDAWNKYQAELGNPTEEPAQFGSNKMGHGSEDNELRMFMAGQKPAAIISRDQLPKWKKLIDSRKYATAQLTQHGRPSSVIIAQPGEEHRVEKLQRLVQNAIDAGEKGDFRAYQNSNYHRWVGKLLGYSADKINSFIQHYFKDTPDLAKKPVYEEQHSESCPHCGGELVSEELMHEKQDACYRKVKSRYKVWPSAYASGALVQCRKKGASNWGNGGKKNESVSLSESDSSDAVYNAVLNRIMRRHLDVLQEYGPTIVMYAIEDVANGVGDLEEIGSSDVSIWTKQVINDLKSGQYAHLKETPTDLPVEGQPSGRRIYRPKSAGTFAEDTAYAGGMGQGGNAGQSYRKFKPKSAGTFKESAIMAGLKRESK